MKKYLRVLSAFFAVFISLSLISACSHRGDAETDNSETSNTEKITESTQNTENKAEGVDGFFTYKITEIGAELTEYSGAETDITVPAEVKGNKVVKIGDRLFKKNYTVKSVTLPDGILEIGEGAFAECEALETISIPSSVKAIGASAFAGTAWYGGLDDEFVTVGDGVAIKYNGNGGNVTIPSDVKYLSNLFRYSDAEITHITLGEGVVCIGQKAFAGLKSLTGVTFSPTVEEIGVGAFTLCTALCEITIPETVTVIREYAFSHCKSLKDVTINAKITELETATFYSCDSLETVELPSTLKTVSADSMSSCLNLKYVKFSSDDVKISSNAFSAETKAAVICPSPSEVEDFCIENNISVNPDFLY